MRFVESTIGYPLATKKKINNQMNGSKIKNEMEVLAGGQALDVEEMLKGIQSDLYQEKEKTKALETKIISLKALLETANGIGGEVVDETEVNKRPSHYPNLFHVRYHTNDVPRTVDPLKTLATEFISPRCGRICHKVMNNKRSMPFLIICSIVGSTCACISIIGSYPSLGWGSIVDIFPQVGFVLLLNKVMLKSILKTFEFWGFAVLIVISTAAFMDAVQLEAPRVIMLHLFVFFVILH